MLKIKDSTGKVFATLEDNDSAPQVDQDTIEFWDKVKALVDSGKAKSKSEAKRMVLQNTGD